MVMRTPSALALLAMMMREEHPLHAPHANLAEMVQHASITKVDEQCGIAITQDVDIAGVGPQEGVTAFCAHAREFPGHRLRSSNEHRANN